MRKDPIKDHYTAFVARVKENNREFEEASPAQKRVIIAKDALTHMEAGILVPAGGGYGAAVLSDGHLDGQDHWVPAKDVDLRDGLVEHAPVCEVCGRGGLVLAALLRRDKMKGTSFEGDAYIPEFSQTMFHALEQAFEGHTVGHPCSDRTAKLLQTWDDFTTTLDESVSEDDVYRFERVMRWIIEHEGSFQLGPFLRAEIPLAQERFEGRDKQV